MYSPTAVTAASLWEDCDNVIVSAFVYFFFAEFPVSSLYKDYDISTAAVQSKIHNSEKFVHTFLIWL